MTAVALAALCLAANAADLRLLTEDGNPPFSFTKDGKVEGLGIEIVDEIQRRLGSNVPTEVYPWPRAYKMLQETPNTAHYFTTRTAEREALFKWVGPTTTIKPPSIQKRRLRSPFRIWLRQSRRLPFASSVNTIVATVVEEGFTNLIITTSPDTMVW